MKRKIFFGCIVLFLLAVLKPKSQQTQDVAYYNLLFKKADSLFSGQATNQTDSLALEYFTKIILQLKPNAQTAQLLYDCNERAGILKQGFGAASKDILPEYYAGLTLQKTFHLPDSVLFRLLLSAGNVHYADGLFDSSVYYFSLAENIINKYPNAGLAGDLYNSLGALYTESGDYMQSAAYFKKALEITKKTSPELGEAIFAMSVNIASALRLSGNYDSAIHLYNQLLLFKENTTPILNNLGRIYLTKQMPDSALFYLTKIKDAGIYSIGYNNSLALAYLQKKDTAQAFKLLTVAQNIFIQNSYGQKNNVYGATCKYFGDLMLAENNTKQALKYYQQAIMQLDYKFNSENIFENPGNFIGDFASYELFNALLAKAGCFAFIYKTKKQPEIFNAAINTYDSAFALADYIKKSIDNDEARLFIADKVFDGYTKAIDFILGENKTNDEKINILALTWISKSRATSLSISLKENTIKQFAGLPDSLTKKEKNIKINISRLKLQLQQNVDSIETQNILSSINSAELQLAQLTNSYKQYPNYYKQKFATDSFNINNIQQKVLDNETAIVCFFNGEQNSRAFVIKKNSISNFVLNKSSGFNDSAKKFIANLSANNPQQNNLSAQLYQLLMQPLEKELNNIHSIIIIPDENLINLPFEALTTNDQKFLVEKYAITYQYAIPFLRVGNKNSNNENAIAFAPFATNNNAGFAALTSSKQEIEKFSTNEQVLNTAATKQNFLAKATDAATIHLATHAVVNFAEPANSYIAFYPLSNQDSAYKLYAHEIYNLQLPNTHLVFLSACETAAGKFSQSEGALSLSRAFAFAGCTNIVTSLWKAEDKSTAYISEKFYYYAGKGYTYAAALQHAKTDLLKDAAMSQFHAPQYWSHLIFIGDVQQQNAYLNYWIAGAVILLLAFAIIFIKRKK